MSVDDNELPSGVLGTREYWDDVYVNAMKTPDEEVGPGWFGESATKRVINWMTKSTPKDSTVLDIGCGGGEVLIELLKKGFTNLCGTDYSPYALEVGKSNLDKEGFAEDKISFQQQDITNEVLFKNVENDNVSFMSVGFKKSPPLGWSPAKFQVCLDKGTYDAISLCPENAREKRKAYIESVQDMLLENGVFIIVSCNWTSEELKAHFSCFKFREEIKAPSFSFGGQVGQTVSTCIFSP